MNEKEKAKELVDRFQSKMKNSYWAKDCALVCVDEIMKSKPMKPYDTNNLIGYWQVVKTEIEKL